MKSENFTKWFTEQLLPHIPPRSLIVMDKAPYHNELTEEAFPTPKTRKAQLQHWLLPHHPAQYGEDMLKPELYQRGKPLCPPPPRRLDRSAEAAGHPIIRTPPYHPELQPIETVGALIQEYCATRCDYTLAGLNPHLEAGFDQVTPSICQSLIQIVRLQEDQYGVEDQEDDDSEFLDFTAL